MSVSEPMVATSAEGPTPESELLPTTQQPRDRFGNLILDAPGPLGQYRIRSARDGRILRVCGEAAAKKHLLWWDYDEGERRMICMLCWPRGLETRQEHSQESDHV